MDVRKLQKIVVAALEDIKGIDIEVINTTKLTALFDRIVVASGVSNRQVKSLARHVGDKVREAGYDVIGIEGEAAGEWVLVDLGAIVVHVMQPTVRSYYNLEELWQARPTRARKTAEVALESASDPAVKPLAEAQAPASAKAPAALPRRRRAARP